MNTLLEKIHGYDIYKNFPYTNYEIRNLGWNVDHELFKTLINQTQPKNILELGSWYGSSAICMGNIIKELNIDTKIVCVDTWLGSKEFIGLHEADNTRQLLPTFGYPNAYYQFLANICYYNLQDIIIPFPQTSSTACKWLKEQNSKFELIYIDGSNDSIDVYYDIIHAWSLLKDNGIVFGDDYNNPSWLSINVGLNKFCAEQGVRPIFLEKFKNHWTIVKNNKKQSQKLIFITCTYNHSSRISYIKYLIKNIISKLNNYVWIIVEDGESIDTELSNLLYSSNINYIYMHYGPTRSGGNAQRNFALEYIADSNIDGIVYSLDDDNIYDLKLFDEIRKTQKLSIFPVGGWGRPIDNPERPILDNNNKFIKWNSTWQRKYATDMAGFAFNSNLLHKIKKPFWTYSIHGGGESEFIDRLISNIDEIEFNLCNFNTNCYVYHNALREVQHPDVDSLPVYRTKNNIYKTKYGHSDSSKQTQNIISNILKEPNIESIFNNIEFIYNNTDGSFGGPDRIEIASIINNIRFINQNSTIIELGCWKGRVSAVLHLFKSSNNIDVIHVDNFYSNNGLDILKDKQELIVEEFKKTLERLNIDNYILVESSIADIEWCILLKKPISYIYYDMNIDFELGKNSLVKLIPFMDHKCIIEFHDSSWTNTCKLIEYMCLYQNFSKLYKIDIWEGSLVIQKI